MDAPLHAQTTADTLALSLSEVLPRYAKHALAVLEGAGYEAWVVGGWIRDALLGSAAHDVDIATDAYWKQAAEVLRRAGYAVYETGSAYGTVTVVIENHPLEVTTYRIESSYSDSRHPDDVRFSDSIRLDLARRDFTVNAMAFNPSRGLLDPYLGQRDLRLRLIRAVGDARERFEEDALRVLRAVRFACRLDFSIEAATDHALAVCAPRLASIARERIGAETRAIVETGRTARALRIGFPALAAAIPELAPMDDFDQQSPFHAYDVREHTARVCAGVEAFTAGTAQSALRWAALLHDIAKPMTFSEDEGGRGHFFGHPEESARMAHEILEPMGVPQSLVAQAAQLIRWHDLEVSASASSIRRFIATLDEGCAGRGACLATQIIELKRADALAKTPYCRTYAVKLDVIARMLHDEIRVGAVQSPRDLAVSGNDVMRTLDLAPGPAVGMYLRQLFEAYLAGEVANEREALLTLLTPAMST